MQIAETATAEHAIIAELDQAWTDRLRIEYRLGVDRWDSWEARNNAWCYLETAQRTIDARRAELDALRAELAASEERVNRLAAVALDTGLLKAATVAYLAYGPAVLAADAPPAPWEPTAREVAEEDRRHWADREYDTEPDDA